ncbi:glyoxalase/bleomycin resistance/extradiol dioxygenase family protein [Rhodobacterales bacterium HKCCE2091]|nr:glyoxalase/bleomycin resistance/extradiol dioxygenase family protein [Rhodobacterales bacterium HKCCE2091]
MVFSQPVPALPVRDLSAAQAHYRDRFGFQVGWRHDEGRIGAVSHGDCAIFLREVDAPFTPHVFWVHMPDLDAAFAAFTALGAGVVAPPADQPYGLRQFTLCDLDGHIFHFHREL